MQLLISWILFSWQAVGSEYGIDIERFFTYNSAKKRDYYLTIGYRNTTFLDNHQETSSNSIFRPFGQQLELQQHGFDIGLGQEFFARHYLSFTLYGSYGRSFGIEKGDLKKISSNDFNYKERGIGQIYGAGATLQINFSGYGILISPFVGAQYLFDTNSFVLDYTSISDKITTQVMSTKQTTILQYQAGVRFLNPEDGIMSFFSIQQNQFLQEKNSLQGSANGVSLDLATSSPIQMKNISYQLGIGFMF